MTATPDPPPSGIPNPIHDAEGADGAGYTGALVAGVRTYGWAAQTIARALGDDWLSSGWVDVTLRRPLFAGEQVTITFAPQPDREAWSVSCEAQGQGGSRVVLDGEAGSGDAPWLSQLEPPAIAPGQEPPPVRPVYDLESIPIGQPLRPLSVYVKADAARRLAISDLAIADNTDAARYLDSERPVIHPYFLAGRMAPLTRHNFTYGPTIHVRSQIQHRARALADQRITVGATIVDAHARYEHWYQVLDGVVSGENDEELARIRHHTIFRPRGTSLPAPIRS